MSNFGITDKQKPSAEELEKEVRSLRRKLTLAEANLERAKHVASAQERVDTVLAVSLQKELQFFKLVLDNATNLLLLFDFDGRFAYASKTFLEQAGFSNFGLINGRQFKDVFKNIISGGNLLKFAESVETAVQTHTTVTYEQEIDFNFRDLPRTFSVLITPMTDDDGKISGIMAVFNDITKINDALEAAKRANLAKSTFLANMSHEIRTPLNAVIGMAAIAQSNTDIDKIRYCLDKINDSSTHLLGVINDILDMSKIETSHFELSFSDFVFEKMLLRIVDVIRFKIDEKKIDFSLSCDPRIPYAIQSDEQRLAQVIMNLLSNAVKFTPEGGRIEMNAQVESVEGDEYTLRISVSDSGIGISEEQKPRLFKVFSQADSSISRKFGGTGLGLVISKNIVKKLGGDIWFDSVEDSGTTFTFIIKAKAASIQPTERINRGDISILAVDDMPDVCLSFSTYAAKLGVKCVTATDAKQALRLVEKQAFNLIFVDWKMPETDGLSLVRQLSGIIDSKTIVLMISSADWSEIESEAKGLGVSEFISKPILMPVIESILDKYCDELPGDEFTEVDGLADKTILLVDDIEINREIILTLLEDTGVNIICAENGIDAVDKFNANRAAIDLIFMDVQMPEMDGYEATRRIRSLESAGASSVPIVAMTANVFKEDVERCLESGMNDHIGKPVNTDEIFEKLKSWLR